MKERAAVFRRLFFDQHPVNTRKKDSRNRCALMFGAIFADQKRQNLLCQVRGKQPFKDFQDGNVV